MILAGIDEAGLGPSLGPLVTVSAALEAPDGWSAPTPWAELAEAVAEKPSRRDPRLAVADSKLVHAAGGIAMLELTVAAFSSLLEAKDGSCLAARVGTRHGPDGTVAACPWHGEGIVPFPLHNPVGAVAAASAALARCLAPSRADMAALEARLLHPAEMNGLFASGLNKNAVLLGETGWHLKTLVDRFGGSGLAVHIDKQGGRNDYLPFLTNLFPGVWIETRSVGARESSYRLRCGGGEAMLYFTAKADRDSFATALASMTAKYLRERAMADLNAWFAARVPGLAPTAGYPQDAKRWLADTADFAARERIAVDTLIRRK